MAYKLKYYDNLVNSNLSTLQECRRAIDEIDNILYSLLIKRIKISNVVSKIKAIQSGSRSFFRVFREVEVIRNAHYALQEFYPKAFYIQIWRLFISALLNNERALSISSENQYCYFMSREYFGSFVENDINNNTDLIIDLLKSQKIDCGCLRFPSTKIRHKWWLKLIDSTIKIYAIYPFVIEDQNKPVVFIADIDLETTNNDTTLIVINNRSNKNYLQSILSSTCFSTNLIDHHKSYQLFSINGFISKELIDSLNYKNEPIYIIGSFSNPM